MSTVSRSYQLVFLVDVSIDKVTDLKYDRSDDVSNLVRLSTLKLLTYFANKDDTRCGWDKIKWGYKFYNKKTNSMRHNFRDLNHKTFEQYEKDLCDCFKNVQSKEINDRSASCHHGGVNILGRVCRELLHDFQWDRPDISSPVRKPRRSLVEEETGPINVVFMFSKCPRSKEDLESYLGGSELNENPSVFLHKFMPHQLYRQFYENTKIRLFWVDTGSFDHCPTSQTQEPDIVDTKGLNLIDEALGLIGGGVVPILSLVNMGFGGTMNILPVISSLSMDDSAFPGDHGVSSSTTTAAATRCRPDALLPLSCVMANYTDTETRYKWETCHGVNVPEAQLCLSLGKGQMKVFCTLTLQPIISASHKTASSNKSNINSSCLRASQNRSSVKRDKVEISLDAAASASYDPSDALVGRSERGAERVLFIGETTPRPSGPLPSVTSLSLRVCGTVARTRLPVTCLDASHVWLCTQQTGTARFEEIICQLAQAHLALVVEYEDPHTKLQILGLIQPLTSVSATLTSVQTRMRLGLEKVMTLGHGGGGLLESPDGLRHFMRTSMKHIIKTVDKPAAFLKDLQVNSDDRTSAGQLSQPFQSSCLESWFEPSAASSSSLQGLLQEINSMEATQAEIYEGNMIKDLQRWYRKIKSSRFPDAKEKKTEKSCTASPRKSPRKACKTPRKSHAAKAKQAALDIVRKSPRLKRYSSVPAAPSRGELMRQLSKRVHLKPSVDKGKDEAVKASKRNAAEAANVCTDYKDIEDLTQSLEQMYTDCVQGTAAPPTGAQSITSIALHYMKCQEKENPQKCTEDLLKDRILQTTKGLRSKHRENQTANDIKIKEYQVQVLLLLELESILPQTAESNSSDKVDEITKMLNAISFMAEAGYVNTFLKDFILDNYMLTLPQMVGEIYDELGQPQPEELEALLSAAETDQSSVNLPSVAPSVDSQLSSLEPLSEPRSLRSNRSRKMVHHPSLSDITKRQIVIPTKQFRKPKEKGNKEEKPKRVDNTSKPKKEQESKAEVVKVRRNLFMGGGGDGLKLERRHSMAVMEGVRRSPRKRYHSPTKALKTPSKAKKQTPSKNRAHHILKTKKVAETPAHKQHPNVIWHRQEKERKRTSTVPEVMVVQESPEKPYKKGSQLEKTPGRGKMKLSSKRASFYSAGPECRSRSVANYDRQLADRIAGRKETSRTNTDSVSNSSIAKSPSFLFSQLLSPVNRKANASITKGISPASAKGRLFTSPCKNTRSQHHQQTASAKSHQLSPSDTFSNDQNLKIPVEAFTALTTPVKVNMTLNNVLSSPLRSTHKIMCTPIRSGATPSKAAVKSPHRMKSLQQKANQHQSFRLNVMKSPCRMVMKTPVKDRQDTEFESEKSRHFKTPVRILSPSKAYTYSRDKVSSPWAGRTRSFSVSEQENISCKNDKTAESPLRKHKVNKLKTPLKSSPVLGVRDGSKMNNRVDVSNVKSNLFSNRNVKKQERQKTVEDFDIRYTFHRKVLTSPSSLDELENVTDKIHDNIQKEKKLESINSLDGKKDESGSFVFQKSPSDATVNVPDLRKNEILQTSCQIDTTPSPKKKPAVKTPDSFDKWHRRKRRTLPNTAVPATAVILKRSPANGKSKICVTPGGSTASPDMKDDVLKSPGVQSEAPASSCSSSVMLLTDYAESDPTEGAATSPQLRRKVRTKRIKHGDGVMSSYHSSQSTTPDCPRNKSVNDGTPESLASPYQNKARKLLQNQQLPPGFLPLNQAAINNSDFGLIQQFESPKRPMRNVKLRESEYGDSEVTFALLKQQGLHPDEILADEPVFVSPRIEHKFRQSLSTAKENNQPCCMCNARCIDCDHTTTSFRNTQSCPPKPKAGSVTRRKINFINESDPVDDVNHQRENQNTPTSKKRKMASNSPGSEPQGGAASPRLTVFQQQQNVQQNVGTPSKRRKTTQNSPDKTADKNTAPQTSTSASSYLPPRDPSSSSNLYGDCFSNTSSSNSPALEASYVLQQINNSAISNDSVFSSNPHYVSRTGSYDSQTDCQQNSPVFPSSSFRPQPQYGLPYSQDGVDCYPNSPVFPAVQRLREMERQSPRLLRRLSSNQSSQSCHSPQSNAWSNQTSSPTFGAECLQPHESNDSAFSVGSMDGYSSSDTRSSCRFANQETVDNTAITMNQVPPQSGGCMMDLQHQGPQPQQTSVWSLNQHSPSSWYDHRSPCAVQHGSPALAAVNSPGVASSVHAGHSWSPAAANVLQNTSPFHNNVSYSQNNWSPGNKGVMGAGMMMMQQGVSSQRQCNFSSPKPPAVECSPNVSAKSLSQLMTSPMTHQGRRYTTGRSFAEHLNVNNTSLNGHQYQSLPLGGTAGQIPSPSLSMNQSQFMASQHVNHLSPQLSAPSVNSPSHMTTFPYQSQQSAFMCGSTVAPPGDEMQNQSEGRVLRKSRRSLYRTQTKNSF